MKPRFAASRRHLSSSPFNVQPLDPPVEQFAVGDRVSHDAYGLGRVLAVEGEAVVVVDFGAEQRRLSTPFKRLVRL
ncbi:MAG: hypothetical protein ACRDUV_08050 [Pseudonocardiaceae bacterium]